MLGFCENVGGKKIILVSKKIHTYTVRNKQEKLEDKDEAIFDTPFSIQSHAKNEKKRVKMAVIFSRQIPNGSQNFSSY